MSVRFQSTNEPELTAGVKIRFEVSKYPSDTFGQYIEKLRLKSGPLQKELVSLLDVHEISVVGWEKSKYLPKRGSHRRLVQFFEIGGRELAEHEDRFNVRQQKLIEMIREKGEISKQEYLGMWSVSLSAADQDVKDLKDLGILRGEKRGN